MMIKRSTPAQIAAYEKRIVAAGRRWKSEYYPNDPNKLAVALWNKFGYFTSVENGEVLIWAGRKVIAVI